MKKGGLRMALEKVRRRRLHCLSPVRISDFVFSLLNRIFYFLWFKCVSKKIKSKEV